MHSCVSVFISLSLQASASPSYKLLICHTISRYDQVHTGSDCSFSDPQGYRCDKRSKYLVVSVDEQLVLLLLYLSPSFSLLPIYTNHGTWN